MEIAQIPSWNDFNAKIPVYIRGGLKNGQRFIFLLYYHFYRLLKNGFLENYTINGYNFLFYCHPTQFIVNRVGFSWSPGKFKFHPHTRLKISYQTLPSYLKCVTTIWNVFNVSITAIFSHCSSLSFFLFYSYLSKKYNEPGAVSR